MKTRGKLFTLIILILAILVFVPLQSAAAKSGSYNGQVIFGQTYTLKTGETLTGDLLVFGGTATIEQGATVSGNIVLFGSTLVVNGEVSGDVAVIGGTATLGATAHLHGNLTTVGATLDRAVGAQIDGQVNNSGNLSVVPGSQAPIGIEQIITNFNPFGPLLMPSDRRLAWVCWLCWSCSSWHLMPIGWRIPSSPSLWWQAASVY